MPNALPGYVRFLRGTKAAFDKIEIKDIDTLYFIYDSEDQTKGSLYLGNKLIGGGNGSTATVTDINDLANVLISNVQDKQILTYDASTKKWVNKTPEEIQIEVMTGATADTVGTSGLVPAPAAGEQDKYLRGDGMWAAPLSDEQLTTLGKVDGLETRVGSIETKYDNLIKDAPAALDTLKEIADWITKDETGTQALIQRVTNIETKVTGLQDTVGDITKFTRYAEGDTVVSILNDLDGRMKWSDMDTVQE
jgi:hypothetical protein